MAAFNISEFKSNISEFGILQNNKFAVFIPIQPTILLSTFTNTADPMFTIDSSRTIQFRAESASIPGMSVQTADVHVYGTGVTQKMPFNAVFPDITMTFIADSKDDVYKYFYSWATNIVDFTGTANFLGKPSYEIGYKSDYTTDINIMIYDNFGKLVKMITLYEAFPDSITEIPLSWEGNNTAMKFTVKFSYTQWDIFGINSIFNLASDVFNLFTQSSSTGGNDTIVNYSTNGTTQNQTGSFGFVDNPPQQAMNSPNNQ